MLDHSTLKHEATAKEAEKTEEPAAADSSPTVEKVSRTILFSRVSCPNCTMAMNYLAKAGLPFEKIIADDHMDLAREFGVKQTPTLIVTDGLGNFEKFAGAGAIRAYAAEQKLDHV